MLKLTKKADYGLMAMKHLAESAASPNAVACSAKDVAEAYSIPSELLAKILQRLAKAGLLTSQHGIKGGYVLARDPQSISVLEVIKAVDGPLALTACTGTHDTCQQSQKCNVKQPLHRINDSIRVLLNSISVADLKDDFQPETKAERAVHGGENELVVLTKRS